MDIKDRIRSQIRKALGDETYEVVEAFANALVTGHVFAPVRVGPQEEVYITIMGPGIEPKFIDTLVDEPGMVMRLISRTQEKYGDVDTAFVAETQEQFNTVLLARHTLMSKAKETGMTSDEFFEYCIDIVKSAIPDQTKEEIDAIPD